jgi:hypothetical protein
LEQSTLPEELLKELLQLRRKKLREDALLTQFDKDTILAQLEQIFITRNMGKLLETKGKCSTGQANVSKVIDQAGAEEVMQTKQSETEEMEKRKLGEIIKEARLKKGKQEHGVFRANTVREG